MCQSLSLFSSFFDTLRELDEHTGAQVQAAGCPYCGGRLHRADYPRKPRGIARAQLDERDSRRVSLCCAEEGCRRRTTPVSVRFLGRRVYFGFLLVLSCSVRVQRVIVLGQTVSIPQTTIRRWQRWWRERFVRLAGWASLRLELATAIDTERLPDALWQRFGPPSAETLVRLVRQINPLVQTL